jgi:hypothetical protein
MRNKKALSEVIGYVLLITIGISIAIMVGAWLKLQVPKQDTGNLCPEETSLVVSSYECKDKITNSEKEIEITIKNKGFFKVDGFTIKFSNFPNAGIGIYNLKRDNNIFGVELNPDSKDTYSYSLKDVYKEGVSETITDFTKQKACLIEVQPFTISNGEKNFCQKVSYKEISSDI